MQELTLVGLTEDGARLLLVSDSGEEFTLPADAKLRAALRGDHARLGQLEIQMESALRPKDIQARIRAGESPESVAAAAQTTVDRIMRFASPVLAERAHVADRALRASVRRKAGEGPSRLLADAVAEHLRERGIQPESVEWDAWRREDGRWTLVADYLAGDSTRHAEFVYDAPGRYVVAEDDEARRLVGEPTTRKAAQPRQGGGGQRRLTAVSLEDQELPLGADAIDLVREPAAVDAPLPEDEVVAPPQDTSIPDDEPTVPLPNRQVRSTDTAPPAEQHPAAVQAEPTPEAGEEQPEAPQRAKKPAKKSRGRASVPSWDEIMFGGGRSE